MDLVWWVRNAGVVPTYNQVCGTHACGSSSNRCIQYYNVGTHLLVKKRFGERQPAFDGHHDGHTPGAQPEEPPQDADPARPHVVPGARPADTHEHLDQHAGEGYAIVGGQAPQHEPVLLVAA